MPIVWEVIAAVLAIILIVQAVRLAIWVSPIDRDTDTIFVSWPYFLALAGIITAVPSRFTGQWEPARIQWGVLMILAAMVIHLLFSGHLLWRAWKHHGQYKMFWF